MDSEAREARRRLVIAGVAVAAVLAVTFGLLFALRDRSDQPRGEAPTPGSASSVPAKPAPGGGRSHDVGVVDEAVFTMPKTGDAKKFGEAYAVALSTWDSTEQSLEDRRKVLLAWTPPDGWWTDAESMLDDWLGDEATWDAAARARISQTVVVNRVWIPVAVQEWMRDQPDEWAADNYALGVNVNMTRLVRGDPGANQDLSSTMSVLIACPPKKNCVGLGPARSVIED